MKIDRTCANPTLLGDLTRLYRTLLREYSQQRRTSLWRLNERQRRTIGYSTGEFAAAKMLAQDLILRRLLRKAPHDAGDYFGREVVRRGGSRTLTRLQELDSSTLAALVEWNKINLSRIERRLFFRGSLGGLLAVAAALSTFKWVIPFATKLLDSQLWTKFPYHFDAAIGVLLGLLLGYAGALYLLARIFGDLVDYRPSRKRVTEFGQLLAIAAAYRHSKTDSC